jgi:DNA-directed RNA polymerase specialized sigma24 family protein
MYNTAEVEMIEDTLPAIKQDIEIQYRLCKKLVYKISHNVAKRFRELESTEIIQKAEEIFTECYYKYNNSHQSKAKLSTYLYSVLNRKLYKWCVRSRNIEHMYFGAELGDNIKHDDTDYLDSFGYFKNTLSDSTKMVVETIVNCQSEIENRNAKYVTKPNKHSIMKFLTEEKNMRKKEVLNSYAEITSMLRG